jgi:hypothetical protein
MARHVNSNDVYNIFGFLMIMVKYILMLEVGLHTDRHLPPPDWHPAWPPGFDAQRPSHRDAGSRFSFRRHAIRAARSFDRHLGPTIAP